jgi:hypothetical protein
MVLAVPRDEVAVMLVVDVSGSMAATDLQPTRLGAAKQAGQQLLDALPANAQAGLITFDTTARVAAPLTTDSGAVKRALGALIPGGGTAIGDGLSAALDQLDQRPTGAQRQRAPAAVILFSDGQSNADRIPPGLPSRFPGSHPTLTRHACTITPRRPTRSRLGHSPAPDRRRRAGGLVPGPDVGEPDRPARARMVGPGAHTGRDRPSPVAVGLDGFLDPRLRVASDRARALHLCAELGAVRLGRAGVRLGILISENALPALGLSSGRGGGSNAIFGFWHQLHTLSADAVLVLAGIHLGLNWRWVVDAFKRIVHIGGRRGPAGPRPRRTVEVEA